MGGNLRISLLLPSLAPLQIALIIEVSEIDIDGEHDEDSHINEDGPFHELA